MFGVVGTQSFVVFSPWSSPLTHLLLASCGLGGRSNWYLSNGLVQPPSSFLDGVWWRRVKSAKMLSSEQGCSDMHGMVSQAFYKVIRQQAFDCSFADKDVMKFLVWMGVDDYSIEDVAKLLASGSTKVVTYEAKSEIVPIIGHYWPLERPSTTPTEEGSWARCALCRLHYWVTAHASPSVTLAAHIARAHGSSAKSLGYKDYALFLEYIANFTGISASVNSKLDDVFI